MEGNCSITDQSFREKSLVIEGFFDEFNSTCDLDITVLIVLVSL
jgi:hypothetical protein